MARLRDTLAFWVAAVVVTVLFTMLSLAAACGWDLGKETDE